MGLEGEVCAGYRWQSFSYLLALVFSGSKKGRGHGGNILLGFRKKPSFSDLIIVASSARLTMPVPCEGRIEHRCVCDGECRQSAAAAALP